MAFRNRFGHFGCIMALAAVGLTVSCGDRKAVVGEGFLQKRKYRPGWHVEFGMPKAAELGTSLRWAPARRIAVRVPPPHQEFMGDLPECTPPQWSLLEQDQPLLEASLSIKSPKRQDPHGSPHVTARLHRGEPHELQPQDTLPERTRWNRYAVASLPLLIIALAVSIPLQSTFLLLIGSGLALAAAIIGARQCRDRGERGQGFALATMGFAAAAFLLSVLAFALRI